MEVDADYHAALITDALQVLAENAEGIPLPLVEGLRMYLTHRIETGGFLRACLSNDFTLAIALAHPSLLLREIKGIQQVLMGCFPSESWGSPQKVADWLGKG